MVQLKTDEMKYIEPLFRNWEETMIWSCLQGVMGQAWADCLPEPRSARILTGDFCFLAGQPDKKLVCEFPSSFSAPFLLIVPREESWCEWIEACYPDTYEKFYRYALKKEKDIFDRSLLESYIQRLPQGYELRMIDRELYPRILSGEWSRDLCSQFPDSACYEQLGLGFAALKDGEIAGGASSYTVYNGGIEIEIDVKQEHRRKGIARACAARLILACLDRGLYPSWDAANTESLHLAETLGYHSGGSYISYEISFVKGTEKRNAGNREEGADV